MKPERTFWASPPITTTARLLCCAMAKSSLLLKKNVSRARSTIRNFRSMRLNTAMSEANVALTDVDYIVFYDKPLVKFERLLETYFSYAPNGIRSFLAAMPVWLKEKLYLKATLKDEFTKLGDCKKGDLPALLFAGHHQSHAASAFYPSLLRANSNRSCSASTS